MELAGVMSDRSGQWSMRVACAERLLPCTAVGWAARLHAPTCSTRAPPRFTCRDSMAAVTYSKRLYPFSRSAATLQRQISHQVELADEVGERLSAAAACEGGQQYACVQTLLHRQEEERTLPMPRPALRQAGDRTEGRP